MTTWCSGPPARCASSSCGSATWLAWGHRERAEGRPQGAPERAGNTVTVSADAAGLHPQVLAIRERQIRDKVPHLTTLTIDQARSADLAAIVAGTGNVEAVG